MDKIYENKPLIKAEKKQEKYWESLWANRYIKFVTGIEKKNDFPDVLFIDFPSLQNIGLDALPEDESFAPSPNMTPEGITVTTGLACLGTAIKENTPYSVGIFYGNNLLVGSDETYQIPLPLDDIAKLVLSSKAKVIGITLMAAGDVPMALKIIERSSFYANESGIDCPKFVVGGAYVSLNKKRAVKQLGLNKEQAITGRAFNEMLSYVTKVIDKDDKEFDVDYTTKPFDPSLVQVPGSNNGSLSVTLNLVSSGGKACVAGVPCKFCTAYFIGERQDIPMETIKEQVDLLKKAKFKFLNSSDNQINLANKEEREKFLDILDYIDSKEMVLWAFLSRADKLARTPQEALDKIRNYKVKEVLLGIESGDIDTILAMNKVLGKRKHAKRYVQDTIKACQKLKKANLKPVLSAILAYPIDGVDGSQADYNTLRHLSVLLKEVPEIDELQVGLFGPHSGSEITKELVERGASQDNLDHYMAENEILWKKVVIDLQRKYQTLFIELVRETEGNIPEVLEFLKERREVLNKFLTRPFENKST